ncbi:hypothetical protein ACRCRN_23420 [Pseudomonas aeruginosa]
MTKANECTCPSGDGSLVHPCPAHPAVEQAGGDRRDALQSIMEWTAAENIPDDRKLCLIRNAARAALAQPSPKCATCNDSGQIVVSGPHYQGEFQPPEYETEPCDMCAQPSPAQAEQAEAERPEVVAWQYRVTAGPQTGWSLWHPGKGEEFERSYTVERRPLMTVAQYDRIVGELRAVIAQLRQHKNDYMDSGQETYRALQNEIREREAEIARLDGLVSGRTAERDAANARLHEVATACATAEQERDAALARVAEVEAKLADLEKQEPFYYFADCDDTDHSGLHNTLGDALTQVADHGGSVVELYRKPPAQAQHSVPELLVRAEDFVSGKEVPQAWLDVQAERRRQVEAEGWTPEHDDLYCAAELPRAAAAYILNGANDEAPAIWPFSAKWWKPSTARRDMVKACALALAEIERLDRAAHGKEGNDD